MIGCNERPIILVIDPDGELEHLIREIAAGSGCEVVCAECHGLGHDTFSFPNPFALAIMTITQRTSQVSRMISAFRKLSPNAEFILLSRSADDHMWGDTLANGAYDLFRMPADPKELSKAIFEILARYERELKLSHEINAA